MSVVVVGATAGVGRALGRELASRGHALLLVGRNIQDLEAEQAHLSTVYGRRVWIVAADASRSREFARFIADAAEEIGDVEALLFPIGASRPDDDGSLCGDGIEHLLSVNLTSVIAVCETIVPTMAKARRGAVVAFGSVAATRGRGSNIVYSAAKRGLESYFESLRHRLAGTGVRATVYRLGYVSSKQTFGKRLPFPAASPDRVAKAVCDELTSREGLRTYPGYWAALTLLVRMIPWAVFKHMKF